MGGKKHTLRFRAAHRDIFNAIRRGRKRVETRAATAKYRGIGVGDTLSFVCGRDTFEKLVRSVRVFRTIAALLKRYSAMQIHPSAKSAKELRAAYYGFPNYREKIRKHGIIAWELA